MTHSRPPLWLSSIAVILLTALWGYFRLFLFRDTVMPLTFVLPLMICVWTQHRWQLWSMATAFAVMTVVKVFWVMPAEALSPTDDWLLFGVTLFNIALGTVAVQAILSLRSVLEARNEMISAQNAELEAQAEELTQQNEEIMAQAEELAEQNEELESQAQEVASQNDELAESNQRIQSREEILHGLLRSSRTPESSSATLRELCSRTLTILGAPATSVAMLEREGDWLVMQAHSANEEACALPERWPLEGSIGKLVLTESRTAYVSDLMQLAALSAPFNETSAVRSILATPVRFAGSPDGVLIACSPMVTHWTQEQFRVVEWVAAQCGLIAETHRWQQALTQRALEVEAANRAKDNFLAALSHELRMPLSPVLMTASALRFDERLPEDVRAQLGMIERNIALEARLIDDLLDLTRIVKGKLTMRPQLCDAHSLIGLAVEIVRDEVREKGIVMERELHAKKSGVMADPSRFQQVIWNLLRNAVKFTPAGGRITIRTLEEPSQDGDAAALRIEIVDSGIGIEPAAIPCIFEPFNQGGLDHDHRYGGLGLGLAIVRAIVDLHGGKAIAESAGRNQGATFRIDLPGATEPPLGTEDGSDPQRSAGKNGAEEEKARSSAPLRLLLVEDHQATLQVLTRLLTRVGHSITAVSSVTDALAKAQTHAFDAVISDLGLPDGTGNELMEQLRDRHGLKGIALSGYGMEEDLDRSRRAGFIAHLIKPVDWPQLRDALSALPRPALANGAAAATAS